MTLFALPFFCVGVWMLWSVSHTLWDAWEMRGWAPVDARLHSAGYNTHSDDDSVTYEAYARYSYQWHGQTFEGSRVSIASGSDNIGDYQQELGRSLSQTMASGTPMTAWVNPDNPSEAIIDRGVRWGLLGFKSIFLFVFGGVGLGLLIATWRLPREKDKNDPKYASSPWLLNEKWQTETIASGSKLAMWGAWVFAGIWNLISAPLPWMAYREVVEKDNTIAIVALLFPVIGIGVAVWAIRKTLEWRRFGPSPVVLDPFPGSIGGHVGGTIDLNLPFDSNKRFLVTLTNLNSYTSGSGKNKSTKERALWQDELVAHAESGVAGTRLTFKFDVPEGLHESDTEQTGDDYHSWKLNLQADLPGTDLDRDYNIPVFASAQQSRNLSRRAYASPQSIQDEVYDRRVRELVHVSSDGMQKKLSQPMGRNFFSNCAAILIGGTFAAVGWYLIVQEGQRLFGSVFGGSGALVAVAAVYMLFKSLDVIRDSGSIRSTRKLFGIPIRVQEIQAAAFHRFETAQGMQRQDSGGKHTLLYKVKAIADDGSELLLGEGFRGKPGADAAIRLFQRELGLNPRAGTSQEEPRVPLYVRKKLTQ